MRLSKPSVEERARARLRRKEARSQALHRQRQTLRALGFTFVAYADGELNDTEARCALSYGVQLTRPLGQSSRNKDAVYRTLQGVSTSSFNVTARRTLLRELKALCLCDGPLNSSEESALGLIADALRISGPRSKPTRSAKIPFNKFNKTRRTTATPPVDTVPWFYEFLGCHPTDTEETIKAAYRRLAVRYHPDKHPALATSPEKLRVHVEAFQKLQSAYQEIQKARGIN